MSEGKLDNRKIKVGLISLGCAKNLVDSEIILGNLASGGMEITAVAEEADVLIINTCSFIDSAKEESVDTILEMAQRSRARRPEQCLVVAGCLPQLYRQELPKLLPEVDAFIGIDQLNEARRIVLEAYERKTGAVCSGERIKVCGSGGGARAIKREIEAPQMVVISRSPQFIPDYQTPRYRLTPRHFAYLKIAEGCDHPCSFCIIPRIRGRYRSRRLEDIIQEARLLIEDGVKEINLISQDSTYYGRDFLPAGRRRLLYPSAKLDVSADREGADDDVPSLALLLRELNKIKGDFWIRLLYTHPAHWTQELIETIAECEKVARYVDIPLQHIHDVMLERMRRETTRDYIVELLNRIRSRIPSIALRTTFIVGFPGETEARFESLVEFIKEVKFERLGVFTYSKEEGTRAALMGHQVPDEIKKRRRDILMSEQRKVSRELCAAQVGKTLRVLVDAVAEPQELINAGTTFSSEHGFTRQINGLPEFFAGKKKLYVARSQYDAPDIDGRVYIVGRVRPGEFVKVKVIGYSDYDLLARPM
ncbi:MAG: 30S ribosomal protein S12 methylthiotransferase RimO [Verrucomicrobiia bacterium]